MISSGAELYRSRIAEQIRNAEELLGRDGVEDFAAYRFATGSINGLRLALQIFEDLQKLERQAEAEDNDALGVERSAIYR